jgi:hypothetical protein
MATILGSSNSAPLNSVIMCCAIVTTFSILSRGKLFTLGARIGWPLVYCSCWCKAAGTLGSIVAGPATVTWCVCGCCYSSVLPRSAAAKDTPGVVSLFLAVLCDFFSAFPPSRVCSPDNRWDGVFPLPPTDSCSMLGWKVYSPSRGTPCAGHRSRTTSSGKVAWPNCWQLWHCVRPF